MSNLDKNFEKLISEVLPYKAKAISDGLVGTRGGPPQNLTDEQGIDGFTPGDLDSIKGVFNRADSESLFHKAIAGSDIKYNKLVYKLIAKLQSDLLSQLERDTKLKNMSRIRATAHEASRKRRQSMAGGALINQLLQEIKILSKLDNE